MLRKTCIAAIWLAALASGALAAELNVPGDYATIQAAVDAAAVGDEVILAPGVYVGIGNNRVDYLGKDITIRSLNRDPDEVSINGVGFFRGFLFQNGETEAARLEGVTVRDCAAPSVGIPEGLGGGVFINGASPTIVNCVFVNCDADRGGGVFASGEATFEDCEFGRLGEGNSATISGGGLFVVSGNDATILNCSFVDNSSTFGGGLLIESSDSIVQGAEFRGNSAIWFGGAIDIIGGSRAVIEDCVFENNASENFGGAIDVEESAPTIRNCFFGDPNEAAPGNTAGGRAGAIYFFQTDTVEGTSLIENCQFIGNSTQFGGAIYTENSSPDIIGCVFGSETQTTPRRNSANGSGGAIFVFDDSGPRIRDCAFFGNAASVDGGALYSFSSAPLVENCDFGDAASSGLGNFATGRGGAVYNFQSDGAEYRNCRFLANRGTCGGAVVNEQSSAEFFDCAFGASGSSTARNTAIDCGGAVYTFSSSAPKFTRCEFFENLASSDGGAALAVSGSRNTFLKCAFDGNRAKIGGAISCRGSDAATPVIACKFSGNEADRGGAIDIADGASAEVITSLIRSNTAVGDPLDLVTRFGGGGVAFTDSSGEIINCTIVANESNAIGPSNGGGGLLSEESDVVVANTILWDNTSVTSAGGEESQVFFGGVAPAVSFTLIQDISGLDSESNLGANPNFRDPAAFDYRLGAVSPAIDAGDNLAVPLDNEDLDEDGDTLERLPLDVDGRPRFVDGPGSASSGSGSGQAPIVDMGAHETSLCIADINGDGVVDAFDLAGLLGDWGESGAGDLNGDGGVNAFDLSILLGSWGPCP